MESVPIISPLTAAPATAPNLPLPLSAPTKLPASPLPPLPPPDASLFARFLELNESPLALAAATKTPITDIYLWLARPDIAAYLALHRSFADHLRKSASLDSVTAVLAASKDLVELRRAATAILRALAQRATKPRDPRPETAPPSSSPAVQSIRQPMTATASPPPSPNPQSANPSPHPADSPPTREEPTNSPASTSPVHLPTSSPPLPSPSHPTVVSPSPLHAALARYHLPTDLADLDPALARTIVAGLSGELDDLDDQELDELDDQALDDELPNDSDDEFDNGSDGKRHAASDKPLNAAPRDALHPPSPTNTT